MKRLFLLGTLTGAGLLLASCIGFRERKPPLVVNVKRDGDGCYVTVGGERVTSDQLKEIARNSVSRRGIVVYDRDTPYRCIGGAIYTLQLGGLTPVDAAEWNAN
jgi:hypothetical protein